MTTYVQESNIRRRLSDDLARDLAFVFEQVLDLSPACRNCKAFDVYVDDPSRGECHNRGRTSRTVLARGTCGIFKRREVDV